MQSIKRFSLGLAILFNLFLWNNIAYASETATNAHLESMTGTIQYIDTHRHKLIVGDRSYGIANDVQVETAAGHKGRMALLYPGKRIRMLVGPSSVGSDTGVIHKIYMLR